MVSQERTGGNVVWACVQIAAAGAPTVLKQSKDYVQAVDGILPADWLGYMQAAFGKVRKGQCMCGLGCTQRPHGPVLSNGDPRCVLQDSPFWTEHNYGPSTPYFSYLHKLGQREKSRLDAVIGYLHDQAVRHFPGAKRAKCVTLLQQWPDGGASHSGERREAAWLSHRTPGPRGLWRHHH
jgi:hypothetical protein